MSKRSRAKRKRFREQESPKEDRIIMETPKREKMKSRWVKCWRCNQWVVGIPQFRKGIKTWNYENKDGTQHGCDI